MRYQVDDLEKADLRHVQRPELIYLPEKDITLFQSLFLALEGGRYL